MPDSIFLDTSVLVYAHDTGDPGKRQRCQELIFGCLRNGSGVISAQVLSEFFVTITQKVKNPILPAAAKRELILLSTMRTVDIDATLVIRAVGIKDRWQLSYWDALILAAAERAECTEVCSENMSHGQVYGSVTVRNPFHSP